MSPRTAKPAIQAYVKIGERERRESVCNALRGVSPEWKAEIHFCHSNAFADPLAGAAIRISSYGLDLHRAFERI